MCQIYKTTELNTRKEIEGTRKKVEGTRKEVDIFNRDNNK